MKFFKIKFIQNRSLSYIFLELIHFLIVNAEQKSDSLHAESRFTFPTTCGIQFQLKIVACSNLKIDIENS